MNIPEILSHPIVLLALAILGPLVRDVLVALLRDTAKRLKSDKDPANDPVAVALEAAANAIERAKVAIGTPKR